MNTIKSCPVSLSEGSRGNKGLRLESVGYIVFDPGFIIDE
jgi:hypothetical protein